jgi:hypothetical protein
LEVGRRIEGLSGEVVGQERSYIGKTAIFEDSCSPSFWHWCAYIYTLATRGEVTDPIVLA